MLTNDAREELEGLLRQREDFIGKVYRACIIEQQHAKTFAQEIGHKTSVSTLIFVRAISMLLGYSEITESKYYKSREQAVYRSKEWLEQEAISDALRAHLESLVAQADQMQREKKSSSTPSSQQPASPSSKNDDDQSSLGGIYVYSYPAYLSPPMMDESNRTLYKVGASETGIEARVNRQRRQTEVPEDLVLIRAWKSQSPFQDEEKVHAILHAAGHHHKTKNGGNEWFRTSLDLVDAVIAALSLERIEVA